MAGKPWVDFEWASGLIFYCIERFGGATALWLFKSAAFFGLTLLFVGLLRIWKLSAVWIGLAAPAFVAAVFPANGLRPEIFSTLFFMIELHLLERRRLGMLRLSDVQFLALHIGLYAVWANLHAGFVTGLMLCWCYSLGESFGRKEGTKPLVAFALAAGFLATFANPYGYKLYVVLFDHWRHLGALHNLIEEWRSPRFLVSYLDGYWLLLAFSFAGFLLATRQGVTLPAEHVAAVVVFALFASRSIRTTTYAILLVYPLGLAAWSKLDISVRWRRAMGVAAGIAIVFIAWRGMEAAGIRRFFKWPPPMEAQGPERAAAFLRAEKPTLGRLNLYNPYNWGGYLGYFLYPDYKVFIDGRYLFIDLLKETDKAVRNPGLWRGFLDDKKIDLAIFENDGLLLRYPWSSPHPYTAYAMQYADWALVYWDSQVVIFVRRSKVPVMWLGSHEFRWLRPYDLRQVGLFVVAGTLGWSEVTAEIERYARDIGDPNEVSILESWRREFEKGLAASDPGRLTKPYSGGSLSSH